MGAMVGAVNGVLTTILRYQAVVATLCMYFMLQGVGEWLLPAPQIAPANWTDTLAGSIGPIPGAVVTIGAPLLLWFALARLTTFISTVYAVGGDDVAALTAGINVSAVRIMAYTVGGVVAAIAAFALTGLVRDADPTLGATYTLIAIAAVSLGGTVFGGGRGGLVGSLCGAACIYLIENLLTNLGVSQYWLQVVYGVVLVVAIILSARLGSLRTRAILQ
jgi:ribose transport system permease protein